MGKGHYPNAHTEVTIGPDGTRWPQEVDTLIEDQCRRWSSLGKVAFDPTIAEHKRRRKAFTYFMLACAKALVEESLSPSYPPSPDWLRKEVKRAGGNIRWLYSNDRRLSLLTRLVNLHQP